MNDAPACTARFRALQAPLCFSEVEFVAVLHRLDVERLIRKAGAQRVSEDAGEKLAEFLEDKAIEIIEKAITIARHARGRKAKKLKLTAEDIFLAAS